SVELDDRTNLASCPIHTAERARPNGEHQVSSRAQEGFMDQKLLVAVLVEAFDPFSVAPHAVHPWRRIARKLDPLRIERMKLRMNHCSRERDHAPLGSIGPPDHNTEGGAVLDCRCQPFAPAAKRAFSKLRAAELRYTSLLQCAPVDLPHSATAHEEDPPAVRVNRR